MSEFFAHEFQNNFPKSYSLDFSIRDVSPLAGQSRSEFHEISQHGDRFTIFASDDNKSVSYFGPRISERLQELPSISSVDLIERKLMDIYTKVNQKQKSDTIGSFGITYTSPEGDVLNTTANCGGSLFFYEYHRHTITDLTNNQSTPLGQHSNPNYLNVTTTIIHSGDMMLAIPLYLKPDQRDLLIDNLMSSIDNMSGAPAVYIAQKSADYIAKSLSRKNQDVSLLTLSAVSTRSLLDRRMVDHKFLVSSLREFKQARDIDEVLNLIHLMRGIQGLNRNYSYKDIRKLINQNDYKSIPRAYGLREAVIRLNKSSEEKIPKIQNINLPQEIL